MISNTVIGAGALLAATGVVFAPDMLAKPPVIYDWIVVCDTVRVVDEFTTPEPSGCRLDGIPIRVILPILHPY